MLSLVLESPTDSLDLGALLNGTEGVQAIAGLTGAGLPPVSVQWSEGAGDGSTFRDKRVLPRDIDIPLFIAGDDRAGLRAVVKRLAMILADEATLRLVDSGGESWTLKVVRTGGGDFIYGVDTDGELDLALTITLRAGQPFWTAVATTEVVKSNFTTPTLDLNNPGSVDTLPLWEIRGPGKNLRITSPDGEVIEWMGTLSNGETLFIDSDRGEVRTATGISRYAELSQSPRFAKVRAGGISPWVVDYPNADSGLARTNLCANPNGMVDTTGWIAETGITSVSKDPVEGIRFTRTNHLNPSAHSFRYSDVAVTPGSAYSASAVIGSPETYTSLRIMFAWYASGVLLSTGYSDYAGSPSLDRISHASVAPAGATHVRLRIWAVAQYPAVAAVHILLKKAIIEKAPTAEAFFDGSTTDTATNIYAWTGTAGSSTSTLTLIPDRSTSQVRCRINPRDWMVV